MKTNIFYYLICLALCFGCDDNLDIEPEQSLTPEAATATAANIQNILVGAYDLAGNDNVFSGEVGLTGELLANSGNINWRGTFLDPAEFNRKRVTTTNLIVSTFWSRSYESINQANLVLKNLDVVVDPSEKSRIEGEAKFIRGVVLFELVRYYGQPYQTGQQNTQLGVPILTDGVSNADEIELSSRNTVEEVYTQVLNDLTDARDLLPTSNTHYADKYDALAVLARVYLQQGNFTSARDAANDVINLSGQTLANTFAEAFNNESNGIEDVFAWQITTQDGVNDFNTFWATRNFGGRSLTADITVETPYFSLFTGNDDRKDFFYSGNGTMVSTKWQNQFANVPFIRLAELHLIRAEANFREGTTVGMSPMGDINRLRDRAKADLLTAAPTLQDILDERQRELAFEGLFYHDVKRLKLSVGSIPFNANELILPIPQREIDVNSNLQQNPGYN